MFLLGILSLFQVTLLPGLILLKILKIKTDSFIQTYLYSFGLSLFFNFLLICLLAWLKLYTYTNVYVLFLIEILLLVYLIVKREINFSDNKNIKDFYIELIGFFKKLKTSHKIIFSFACVIILFFVSFIPVNAWNISYVLDAVARDTWVRDWASNKIPLYTGHYPQLLISNLSLFYVFMQGTALQFFPKLIMPFFFIGVLLIFLDLYLQKKSIVYLIGLIVYGIIIIVFYSLIFSGDCNFDIPVSFFGFLTFYTIIKQGDIKFNAQNILLIALFASVAADTKLAGMYIVTFSFLWIAFVIFKNKKEITKPEMIKITIWIAVIFCGNLFWYLIMPSEMYKGLDKWASMLIPNYFDRFLNAANMLVYSFGSLLSIFLLATIVFSLFVREVRYVVLIMIIPTIFLWMLFYSYDYRNLSISIPFIAYSSSFGLKYFYNENPWLQKMVLKFNSGKFSKINFTGRTGIILSFVFVIFFILLFLITGTNYFFNFGMDFSYFMNKVYFMYYRIIYTTELGYYKHVEYFVDTLRIFSVALLLLFLLRKMKIKLSHIAIFFAATAVLLNFTLLKEEALIQRQIYDTQMVKARNLQNRVYSHINTGISGRVITDYSPFCRLIPPNGIQYKYSKTVEVARCFQVANFKSYPTFYFILLEENKLSNETKENIKEQIKKKNYIELFDDGEFIFLKVVS